MSCLKSHFRLTPLALALFLQSVVSPVQAGSVDLCAGAAGWRAVWDSSLDPYVLVGATDCAQLANGSVSIFKNATFTQGPVNGVFPAIPIVFMQTGLTNVVRIIIDNENVLNSTGVPWNDFHLDLIDSGDALFNPGATAASGGPPPIGWDISPFTVGAFNIGNTRLDLSGGVVANGSFWTPGASGGLVIDVNPHTSTPFTTFTLKETPTPEPTTLALLAMGGLMLRRRR